MADQRIKLLEVKNLKKHFPIRRGLFETAVGYVKAVDGVSFYVRRGETLGLVGESGSGKTTIGRVILRAIEPTGGEIVYRFHGDEVISLTGIEGKELRAFRAHAQMIFQDPYSSLSPRMTVRDIIGEPLIVSKLVERSDVDDQIREVAFLCQLNIEHLRRYPHAFSGGQRQRIGIARALVLRPEFIVCDEPVSALDVSIQAQILNLLMDLQEELSLTYLFIAHDLSVIEHMSDRVAVMYLGRLVEMAPTEELFYNPLHPYTEALMSAIPSADPDEVMEPVPLEGEIPSPADPPVGCYFHPRCRFTKKICEVETPVWKEYLPGHFVACHFADALVLCGADKQHRFVVNGIPESYSENSLKKT